MMKRIANLLILILCAAFANAQVKVEAKLDSAKILMGEQAHLTVNVSGSGNTKIEFPQYKDQEEMAQGIEVVRSELDTLKEGESPTYQSVYTLTSWNPSSYKVPALKVKVGGKEYTTKEITLEVKGVEIDTLNKEKIRPAETIQELEFSLDEWMPYIGLSILVVLLLCVAVYLYGRLRSNKPIVLRKKKRKLLPHEKAMEAIARVKDERNVDADHQKVYYTQLIDILREYLEDRFGINAMEMTSSEILVSLKSAGNDGKIDELRQVFETADLVKFAKYSTPNSEKDYYLTNVVHFIEETKLEIDPNAEELETVLSDSDRQLVRQRKMLKIAISIAVVLAVALLAYTVYSVWKLLGY
ncbi:BatD family protein [Prevotella sp. HUN102]|uniref:BatD family protein n=1 Tax=Prevotella sp. HUN102 TaxID=1392486 RepID=UPI001E4BB25A|nr:BatD family protein [Prevotella sp. HUN102]